MTSIIATGTLRTYIGSLFSSEPAESWKDQALCAQVDPELFFPEKGGSTGNAKKVCRACPVQAECLADALATDDRFGIRGAKSERERRQLKARRVA